MNQLVSKCIGDKKSDIWCLRISSRYINNKEGMEWWEMSEQQRKSKTWIYWIVE